MAAKPVALVTGAASGIGKHVALQLASKGYDLTLLDLDGKGLEATVDEIQRQAPGAKVVSFAIDVSSEAAQVACFERHMVEHGRLDAAVLAAGIGERGDFFSTVPGSRWESTLQVDLNAVLYGIRLSAACMERCQSRGAIVSLASAGGLFTMPAGPVYAAAKAGLVHLTRSAGGQLFKRQGVRLLALCPEFVETPLVTKVIAEDPEAARRLLGRLDIDLLPVPFVADVAVQLITDTAKYKAGTVLLVRQDRSLVMPFAGKHPVLGFFEAKLSNTPSSTAATRGSSISSISSGSSGSGSSSSGCGAAALGGLPPDAAAVSSPSQWAQPNAMDPACVAAWARWATAGLPSGSGTGGGCGAVVRVRRVVVHKLSEDFGAATRVETAEVPVRPPPGQVLVRVAYAGVNASDVNYTAGRYHNSKKAAAAALPYPAGFEFVGVVAALGEGVKGLSVGTPVAAMQYGSFADYLTLPAAQALRVPRPSADMVSLLTSGLTASIALLEVAKIRRGQDVLVTAAAGGTGQFAVQLAAAAGCTVVATAGGPAKCDLVRSLGARRALDYKSEDLKAVLKAEYPRGMDVVYESVGGAMFDAAVAGLADKGVVVVLGMMSAYGDGWPLSSHPGLLERLLWKSAAAQGFFLLRYAPLFRPHFAYLVGLVEAGRLRAAVDPARFVGVDAAVDAVRRLHSGASSGKVVLQVAADLPPHIDRAPISRL